MSVSYIPGLKAADGISFEGNCPRMCHAGVGNLSDALPLFSVLFQADDGFASPGCKDTGLIALEKLSAKVKHKIPRKSLTFSRAVPLVTITLL